MGAVNLAQDDVCHFGCRAVLGGKVVEVECFSRLSTAAVNVDVVRLVFFRRFFFSCARVHMLDGIRCKTFLNCFVYEPEQAIEPEQFHLVRFH